MTFQQNHPALPTEATQIITNQSVFNRLMAMDNAFIGSVDYMGLAYFWNHEYRHTLRDCNVQSRVAVHAAWRANGLPLDGVSRKHNKIMVAALKQVASTLKQQA